MPENNMNLEEFAAFNRPQTNVSDERKILDYIQSRNRWPELIKTIKNSEPASLAIKESFHLMWIETGSFIREKINNDVILTELLTLLLPPYDGGNLVLYRGENKVRFDEGRIGFCWTKDISIAEMFGSGLNAFKSPGLLLRAEAPACSIITGPNNHSIYLGEKEFTVNPSLLASITVITIYPDSSVLR
jgi:hypothetical protein